MSQFSTVYLGSKNDPQPVFRDEAPDDRPWPPGAVMAMTFFPRCELPEELNARLPFTEYYSSDGWPVDFPDEQRSLEDAVKRELQLFPRNWRSWTPRQWRVNRSNPTLLRRLRAQAHVASALLSPV